MRVLLVDPPWSFLEGKGQSVQVQPLGLGHVGAMLAPHHDVRFLLPDTRPYVGDDPWGEIRRAIEAERPDVVGITAMTASYPAAARIAELVKAIDPAIPVVLGGIHATDDPHAALAQAPAIDFVVRGEGEHAMLELTRGLEARAAGAAFDPASVAGLAWRDDAGAVRLAPSRPPIQDLDALPFPLRDRLVWPDDVHAAFYSGVITLRGCPYKCIYCAVPNSEGRQTRYRSPGNVVDEVTRLVERHGVKTIFFHDSVFSLHKKRTLELCRLLEERRLGVTFHCQTRTDRVDPELLDAMKAAGCEQVFFGIESGDEESLARIRKRVPLADIREAVGWAKARGLRTSGFFMIGFPWETEAHIERTLALATGIDLDVVSLFSATPLPGTELWRLAVELGRQRMPDSIDFRTPQVNLTTLDDEAYRDVYARARQAIDDYNQAQMMKGLMAHVARARVSWLDQVDGKDY
ncbi:MAG: radical SAM protein [Deltaproteobacteria bacterium]|nr:radical SAM protein [Deltaproteobacteria bacterium]